MVEPTDELERRILLKLLHQDDTPAGMFGNALQRKALDSLCRRKLLRMSGKPEARTVTLTARGRAEAERAAARRAANKKIRR